MENEQGYVNGIKGYYDYNNYFRNGNKYYNNEKEISYDEYYKRSW